MLLFSRNRDRLRPVRFLTLVVGGMLSSACVAPLTLTPSVSAEPLCPFEGTEMRLEVQAAMPNPDLLQSVEVIVAERVAELAVSPTAVFINEWGQIQIQLPVATDIEQATQLLSSQGALTFRPQKAGIPMTDLNVLLSERQTIPNTDEVALEAVNTAILALFDEPQIQSGDVRDASTNFETFNQFGEIRVEFNAAGAEAFTELTREIAGTGRSVGIFVDDELISAPIVDSTYAETGITGGEAVITGAFSTTEAEAIATQIRSGAFPAPTEIVSLQTVVLDEACEIVVHDQL